MFGIVLKKLFLTLLNKKNTIKWMLRMHSLYLRVSYRKGQSDIHTAVGDFCSMEETSLSLTVRVRWCLF